MNRHERRAARKARPTALPLKQRVEAAMQAWLANDAATAERLARQVLQANPREAVCLHLLAAATLQRGSTADAIDAAERAIAVSGPRADLLALAARAWGVHGNLERSLQRFDDAIAAGGAADDPALVTNRARIATELEQISATRAKLAAAAQTQRDDAGLLAPVAQRFDTALQGLGVTPAGILHDDSDLHRRTFDVLLDVVSDSISGRDDLFVQDLGCGYGALFDVIAERSWFARGRYLGLDVAAQMIDAARARIDDPRARFAQGSELAETSDVVIVAGTWNFKLNADDATWQAYVRKSLANVAAHARHGFAFNLLYRGRTDSPHLFATEPAPWLAACRELGFEPILRSDYSAREFVIVAHRRGV